MFKGSSKSLRSYHQHPPSLCPMKRNAFICANDKQTPNTGFYYTVSFQKAVTSPLHLQWRVTIFIKKLIIMWDKKLKLDFQNKNSNQAKSHLKQIDFLTLRWGYWMLMSLLLLWGKTLINIVACKCVSRSMHLLTFQAHQIIEGIKTSFQI